MYSCVTSGNGNNQREAGVRNNQQGAGGNTHTGQEERDQQCAGREYLNSVQDGNTSTVCRTGITTMGAGENNTPWEQERITPPWGERRKE